MRAAELCHVSYPYHKSHQPALAATSTHVPCWHLWHRRGDGCWCADLGLLDLLSFQSKLPGLLLYSVAIGNYSGDALLKAGNIDTLLSQAENQSYPLNFTIDPLNNHRVQSLQRPLSLSFISIRYELLSSRLRPSPASSTIGTYQTRSLVHPL